MRTLPDVLRRALAGPLPGSAAQMRMAPRLEGVAPPRVAEADFRPAAALLLLYPLDQGWHIPLTVRGSALRHHTSQVSLPGGRLDAGESPEAAALREAEEELAIDPRGVEVIGPLTPLPIGVSRHVLHPIVAVAPRRPEFRVAEPEVERLIEMPLAALRDPAVVRSEQRPYSQPPHTMMDVPYFDVCGVRVWGATAMVLAEFVALLPDVK
ncbi:MAG: CoA pyrophosphatase [Acidimicrobiia bacterium]|nr:CoA pyrophosphatase [Acidimicrobiia bacterium]